MANTTNDINQDNPKDELTVETVTDNSNIDPTNRYRIGTLRYTRLGLVMLFIYLLWGDFCFTLMETVIPSILPLKLKSLNAPNWLLGITITTIPSMMNLIINPIISFRSDRYRSRWGRRIPFLFWSTPFIALTLIFIGCSDQISKFLHHSIISHYVQISPTTTTIIVVVALMLLFQFFNMFISSLYYYLFNDVVPSDYLARFMSLFQVVAVAAISAFNFFMFPYAQTHMSILFIIVAVLYFVGFMVMCWKVKEGQYPPPPDNIGGKKGFMAAVKTYYFECFTHRFYWMFFLMNACMSLLGCMTAFNVLYLLSIGLTMKQFGYIAGTSGIISTLLLYPAGILADKFHPLRVIFVALAGIFAVQCVGYIYLFYDFAPQTVFYISCATTCISLPFGTIYRAANLPMYMKILPKDRYGQFGSADAIVRSTATIVGGIVAGVFMDLLKHIYGGSDFYYRFIPCWNTVFILLALICMYFFYKDWIAHGGLDHYAPPTVKVDC